MLTFAFSLAALILGAVMPLRLGVAGYVGAAMLLFLVQAAVRSSTGFAGSSIEESLLLFNGSWLFYLGFNLQITYRAFAPVLVCVAVPFIFRLRRQPND